MALAASKIQSRALALLRCTLAIESRQVSHVPWSIFGVNCHDRFSHNSNGSSNYFFSSSTKRHAELIVRVPPMAESITEGTISAFSKQVGDQVEADEELVSIETDKIDVSVNVAEGGIVTELLVSEGDTVTVGQPVARVETCVKTGAQKDKAVEEKGSPTKSNKTRDLPESREKPNGHVDDPLKNTAATKEPSAAVAPSGNQPEVSLTVQMPSTHSQVPGFVEGTPLRVERLEKLSRMRKTIAMRLKQSQNTTVSLTTMQEIDMTALIAWRAKYKQEVAETHGVRLGYMGSFTKAATFAAQQVPQVNGSIDTEREVITYRDFVDISIAVSAPKGLVTPVLRDCQSLSIVEIERQIAVLAQKAREGRLTMDDLQGGNLSISNPGIFGSMFGTPVINYPQAAVFNMNSIMDRVVAVDGKPEIRPMMYITLTYDHRLIDGREAVTFLNTVKKYIEDPSRMTLV